MLTVNLETAGGVIEAVEAKAKSIDCPVNMAVVDAGGNLFAHVRYAPGPPRTSWPDARWLARALRAAVPALLFGLRLWAAVCLALYIDVRLWSASCRRVGKPPKAGSFVSMRTQKRMRSVAQV